MLTQLTRAKFISPWSATRLVRCCGARPSISAGRTYFQHLVGAGDAALDKPHAAPMLLALEGSGIACDEAWYVGDTALDMECARNAGCLGVLLGARALDDETFARFPPDLHFPGCAALARHIRGL